MIVTLVTLLLLSFGFIGFIRFIHIFQRMSPALIPAIAQPRHRRATPLFLARPGFTLGLWIVSLATVFSTLFSTLSPVVTPVYAADPIVQTFFVPMPETDIRTSLKVLYTSTGSEINTAISLVGTGDNMIIYYDHWEDGYEADIASPTQSTTQIWGDNNPANGMPPGFATDLINEGTVISLESLVSNSQSILLPRNPAVIRYDGRDKFAGTKAIVATRASWAQNPGTVLAGAVEIYDTSKYGQNFEIPMGQNLPANAVFEYVALFVAAAENNTLVNIDTDGNGTTDITTTLNQGENRYVNGGIRTGATVTSNKPVQVHVLTGDIGANYESRWFTMYPVEQWSDSYYNPVGTTVADDPAHTFVFNPSPTATLTINYETQVGSGSFNVSPNSIYQFLMPTNSAAHFYSAGGSPFFAIATIDSETSGSANNVHDWGFTLVPEDNLTPSIVVGWGPSTGEATPTGPGSPVWITAVKPTTVYVDYDGDLTTGPNTAPTGDRYNVAYTLSAFQSIQVYDPNDYDQTGLRAYTADGTFLTAAWGQDPATAQPGNPYLDLGTTILPLPIYSLHKEAKLAGDIDGAGPFDPDLDDDGEFDPGDSIEYSIIVQNDGVVILGNVILTDTLPLSTTYIANTTHLDGAPFPDDTVGVTPFVLDESGLNVGNVAVNNRAVISMVVTIDPLLAPTVLTVTNVAIATTDQGLLRTEVETIIDQPSLTTCSLDFTNSGGTPVGVFIEDDTVTVTVVDGNANTNASLAETLTTLIVNNDNGDRQTVTLTETGPNTGLFRGGVPTSASSGQADQDGTLYALAGQTLRGIYTDAVDSTDSCSDTVTIARPSKTKVLYLTHPNQGLDRVDPVATGDASTATSALLSASPTYSVAERFNSQSYTNNDGSQNWAGAWTESADGGSPTGGRIQITGNRLRFQQASNNEYIQRVANLAGASSATLTFNWEASGLEEQVAIQIASSSGGPFTTLRSIGQAAGTALNATGSESYDITPYLSSGTTLRFFNNGGTWSAADDQAFFDNIVITATINGSPTTAFTQTLAMASPLAMPAGGLITTTTYVNVSSGSMPANPNITATLKHNGTIFATLTNPTFAGGILTWSGALAADTTIPAGEQVILEIRSGQSGVAFEIQYDSNSAPSKIELPATTIINVDSLKFYDAAYAGGVEIPSATNGQTVYIRPIISDPFGPSDITSVTLQITDPLSNVSSLILNNTNVVFTGTSTKTYEYAWATPAITGTYQVKIIGHEGTEGVTHSLTSLVNVTFNDVGTPSTIEWTDAAGTPVSSYPYTSTQVYVYLTDVDQNLNATQVETLTITVSSVNGGDIETVVVLTETGPNTGIFSATIPFTSSTPGSPNNGTLYGPPGDLLDADYIDPNDPNDTATDRAVVTTPSPEISINKILVEPADGIASVGETVRFDIRVSNPGPTALTAITVTDVFSSAALSYQSASIAPAAVVTPTITWNLSSLAPGGNQTIQVYFLATAPLLSATNVVSATGIDVNSSTVATSSPSTAVVEITDPGLALTKTLVSPLSGLAEGGDTVVFNIELTNIGNTDIITLPLSDDFPAACLDLTATSPAADSIGGGTALWNDLGPLSAGNSTTLVLTYTVSGACSPAINTALVQFAEDENGTPVPSVQDTASITTVVSTIGDLLWYDLNGDGDQDSGEPGIGGAVVSLTLPGGSVITTTTLSDGSYEFTGLSSGTYTVTVDTATLPAGLVPAFDPDSVLDNQHTQVIPSNTEVLTFDFAYVPNLTVNKSSVGAQDPLYGGDTITYTIGISNASPITVTGVTISDTVPANTHYVPGSLAIVPNTAGDVTGNPAGNLIYLNPITVAAHALVTVTYQVTVENPVPLGVTDIRNEVVLTTTYGLTDTATVVDPVAEADLAISKSGDPDPVVAGEVITYTLGYTNNGPATAYDVSITDTLPLSVTFGGVVSQPGTVSGPSGTGQTRAWTVGALASGESASIVFTVTADSLISGTITNTVLITTSTPDNNPNNNSDSEPTTVTYQYITGVVFIDLDDDGVYEPGDGETPIPDISVVITDSLGITHTVTTDASGAYTQTVPPGSTTVNVDETDPDMPAGVVLSPGSTDPVTVTVPTNGNESIETGYVYDQFITGVVFIDLDDDGVYEPGDGETPIPDISVVITDSLGITHTVQTDTTGAYTQTVPPGSTTVNVDETDPDMPAGVVLSPGSTDPVTVIVPANGSESVETGYVYDQFITGVIFTDLDGDGNYEPGDGETPIPDISVVITDSLGITHTVTTDASGAYTQTVPPGSTTVNVDETDPDMPAGVVLSPGSTDPVTVTVPANGSQSVETGYVYDQFITGVVFIDLDNDGVYEPGDGETPIPDISVVITDSLGITHSVTTDASGAYTQTVPPGLTMVNVDETDPQMPAGVVLSSGSTDPMTVTVPANGSQSIETGYVYDQSITGVVFIDLDDDGNYEPGDGETPIPDISVVITDSLGITHTVITDASGAYTQTVPPGITTVNVDETDPQMPAGVVLSSGSTDPMTVTVPTNGSQSIETGYVYDQSITGVVFIDLDDDGNYEPGDGETPIPDISVVITDSLGITHTVTTDASGAYTQTVPPGSTTVNVDETDPQMPTGVVLSSGSTDPATVTVPANGSQSVETGYVYDQFITGVVFIDLDDDGIYEPGDGESPIPDISVVITDSLGITHTVTTDVSGAYTQTVPPGLTTVNVDETDPQMPTGVVLSSGSTDPMTVTVPANGSESVETGYVYDQFITGVVFIDLDDDGVYEPGNGETPIPDISVVITDSLGITHTVTTDASGAYTQTVPSGITTVNVDETDPQMPAGVVLSSGSTDPMTVTVPANGSQSVETGYVYDQFITGVVFIDLDNDGVYEPGDGETPIPNISVMITDSLGITHTVETDTTGTYTQTVPPGSTTVNVDEADPDMPAGVVLSSGSTDPMTVTVPTNGSQSIETGYVYDQSITGVVFIDLDDDGVYEPGDGETPIPDISVVITDSLGITHTVTTDASGAYTQTVPPGSTTVNVDEADPDMPAGVVLSSGSTDPVTVTVPANGSEVVETGYVYDQFITGVVFIDLDDDGVYEPGNGELPIPNISVVITDSLGITYTVQTDVTGMYTQTVPPGSTAVNVDETDPDMPAGVTLSPGSTDPATVTVPAKGSASIETGYVYSPAITISKTPDFQQVVSGNIVTFTITVTNSGGITLTNVTVSDPLARACAATIGILGPGASHSYACSLSNTTVDFTNVATVTGTPPAGPNVSDTDDANVDVISNPGMEVEKSVSLAHVAPNQVVTYTITVTNTGNVLIRPVRVTDTLPTGFSYVLGSGNPLPNSISNGRLIWNDVTSGAGLAPNGVIRITFRATMPISPSVYVNTAVVAGTHPNGVITDTDTAPVVVADPSVEIAKNALAPGMANGLITFTIRITNTGPSTLDEIPLVDHFTGPIAYVGGTPPASTVDNVNQVIAWADLTANTPNGFGRDLAPQESFVITTVFSLTTGATTFTMTNVAAVNGAVDVFDNPAQDDTDGEVISNEPTAIQLLYFKGDWLDKTVVLNWATAVELDNFGFRILRSSTGSLADATEIAFIPGQGHGTASGASYSYTDKNVEANEVYTYWLVDVDFNGLETFNGPVTVSATQVDQHPNSPIFLPLILQ